MDGLLISLCISNISIKLVVKQIKSLYIVHQLDNIWTCQNNVDLL